MIRENRIQIGWKILPPIFEKENIYDSFKTNADYYLYGKKSKEEVVDAIVESFYK